MIHKIVNGRKIIMTNEEENAFWNNRGSMFLPFQEDDPYLQKLGVTAWQANKTVDKDNRKYFGL